VKRGKRRWGVRWKWVSSVSTFKNPLTVTSYWTLITTGLRIFTKSRILALATSSVGVGVLVAVPVP
jgi:hypothetical protein